MRIVFAGSGSFGLPALGALVEGGQEVVLAVTQPDRPAGRGRHVAEGPIKRFARERGIAVLQPADVNAAAAVRRIREARPDLVLMIAFGQKLGRPLLGAARHGAINLHASLLPECRGAAPVAWAILRGETETGLTVIEMTERMDAGDILGQRATPIGPDETSGELADRLAGLGARLVTEVVRDLALDQVERRAQNDAQATLAPRLKKSDGLVRWDQPAQAVHNQIRATTPWPGAATFDRRVGRPELRLVLTRTRLLQAAGVAGAPGTVLAASAEGLDVAAARGTVRILELTPAGKRNMSAADFLHGHALEAGSRFTSGKEAAARD